MLKAMDCGVRCCGNVGWASYYLGDQEINLSVSQFPHLQNTVVLVIKLHNVWKST